MIISSGHDSSATTCGVTPQAQKIGTPPGRVAQWNEVIADPETRRFRPRQLYTGPTKRPLVSIAESAPHPPLIG